MLIDCMGRVYSILPFFVMQRMSFINMLRAQHGSTSTQLGVRVSSARGRDLARIVCEGNGHHGYHPGWPAVQILA
jgi:hypothetical protein